MKSGPVLQRGMLLEFRAENHRSLRDEQGVTFEAGSVDGDETRVRVAGGRRVLPVLALFGANGSGKSNMLSAFAFMREAIVHSQRHWDPGGGVPRDVFAWEGRRAQPSFFTARFSIDNVLHEYGFAVDDHAVVEEWLAVWPHGRKQMWFERDGDTFHFGDHLKGENRAVQELTRRDSLFLSAAAQNNHKQLSPVWAFFHDIRLPRRLHRWSRVVTPQDGPRRWFDDEPQLGFSTTPAREARERFMDLLRLADVGVRDVRVRNKSLELQHHPDPREAWLPLQEESEGTQALFELGPVLLNTLSRGGVAVVDELEASLHPLLVAELLATFHDPTRNPKNAQLIFATHNAELLGTTLERAPLRRDQVWLAEKDESGATDITPLTAFQPRKGENLERGYLQGRYGATPFIPPAEGR
jgi:predicted ATPase